MISSSYSGIQLGINTTSVNWNWNVVELQKLLKGLDIDGIDLIIHANQNLKLLQEALKNSSILALGGIVQNNKFMADTLLMTDLEFSNEMVWFNLKLKIALALQCKAISLCIDPWTSISLNKALSRFFERIKILADMAIKYNITLNMEYISPNVARLNGDKNKNLFCPNLNYAFELIQKIDKSNVKLLLDILHWYADKEGSNQYLPVENIGFLHICDHTELNPNKISDQGRILPFQGSLPIKNLLDILMSKGYSCPISIEIFSNKSYPKIEQVALALTQMRNTLSKG
jgi:sugar phosphate isomerase/epimerase